MEWFWKELGLDGPVDSVYKVKQAYATQMRELKKQEISGEITPEAYRRLDEAETLAITEIETGEQSKRSEAQQRTPETVAEVVKPVSPKAPAPVAPKVVEPVKPKETHQAIQRKTKDAQAAISRIEAQRLAKEKQQQVDLKAAEVQRVAKIESQPAKEVPAAPTVITETRGQLNQLVAQVKQLFSTWPDKILLAEWENIFAEKDKWTASERRQVQGEILPQLKKELIFLPQEVLIYLYDVLELSEVDEQEDYFWFREIQELPAFAFDLAHYLPEYEQEDYFAKRYRLYQLTQDPAWESYQFEIDQLQEELIEISESVAEQGDQDVLNLIGLNLVIENLDELTQRNGSSWNLLDEFSLTEVPVAQQVNPTTKFLQIVFTALATRDIQLADGLYIENQDNSYVETNLHELLVGLTFYRSGDQVKAGKHFKKITNNYQYLVKNFSGNQAQAGPLLQNAPLRKATSASNFNLGVLVRIFVVAVIGLGLIGSLFSDDEGDDYDYNYEELDDYEDYKEEDMWEYFADESEIPTNFSHLFLDDRFDEDLDFEREDFIENFVSEDIQPLFEEYLAQWEEGEYPPYDYTRKYVEKKQPDENKTAYLITYIVDNQSIIEVEDGLITKVIGRDWTPDGAEELAAQAPSFKLDPAELQEKILSEFYFVPVDERVFDEEELGYLMGSGMINIGYDDEIELPDSLRKGSYQLSTDENDNEYLLFLDESGKLVMHFNLDSFGRIDYIWYNLDDDIPDETQEELFADAAEAKPITAK